MQTPDAIGAAAPTIAATLAKLGADDKRGLTDVEVQARLKKYGPNALVEKQKNTFAALLEYFWGPIPWMIEAAALMAFIVGDWGDFTIITSLLLFNAVLGFWEEHEASNALDALKSSLALKARALRDGSWQQIDARTLVPGDIVRLYLGDVVPADRPGARCSMVTSFSFLAWRCRLSSLFFAFNPTWSVSLEQAWCLVL